MTNPDWREIEDYEYTKSFDKQYAAWAWEFLRRGCDYRSAYKQYLQKAEDLKSEFGENWKSVPEARLHDPPQVVRPLENDRLHLAERGALPVLRSIPLVDRGESRRC